MKRVYFIDNVFNPETLLYDFNMQIGDSIPFQFINAGPWGYWQNGYYRLDSIDSTTILQVARQTLHLNCHSCTNSKTISWIEGIYFYRLSNNMVEITFGKIVVE